MNKVFKRVLLFSFIIISFFFVVMDVKANSINKIEMDVFIDSYGNAHVTETWSTMLNEGTEGYRVYSDMGDSTISNFSVSDDSGRVYEALPYWNVNRSFESKAYTNGINNLSNGVELCWGISKYGKRTYTLKYTINNFIIDYSDAQGIYFNFINLDQKVKDAKITIRSDIKFSDENSKIWGFGYDGTIKFIDGQIVLDSKGKLSFSDYMVALVKFNSNYFNTSNISSSSFDSVYKSAFDKDASRPTFWDNIIVFVEFILIFVIPILIFVVPVILYSKYYEWFNGSSRKSGELNFTSCGSKTLPNIKDIDYYREVPCNKDLKMAYWIASNFYISQDNVLKEGIIGAILLKWLKDGLITITETKKGLFNLKDNNYAVDFNNMNSADNKIESELYNMLISASGHNKILEAKEFEKWCKKNYKKIDQWFIFCENYELQELINQGLITPVSEEVAGKFGSKRTITVNTITSKLKDEAMKLKGLKRFLLDFSMMPEREYFEVHIWEEYLIFAELLGIADKVQEQFSKLYPQFKTLTKLDLDINTTAIRTMVNMGCSSYKTAKQNAEYRSSSSSSYSGGGGSSFSSGGRSSGGSSGGGFR